MFNTVITNQEENRKLSQGSKGQNMQILHLKEELEALKVGI